MSNQKPAPAPESIQQSEPIADLPAAELSAGENVRGGGGGFLTMPVPTDPVIIQNLEKATEARAAAWNSILNLGR